MSQTLRTLPDFRDPPINEVVIGVQTDPIEKLTAPYLGLFWAGIRAEYPKTEEQPALEPVMERFGDRKPSGALPGFRILQKPETPRCWFISESDNELVQLQQDRLIHNWRKRQDGDRYPRYERIRESFRKEMELFRSFLEREQLGRFVPNQCEVTYINHVRPAEKVHSTPEQVFTSWNRISGTFLPPPEDAQFAVRFMIPDQDGKPLGRLIVQVQSAFSRKDDSPVYALTLTARGRPEGEGPEGVLRFLDRGHEWVVRAFTDLTSPEMHKTWGRVDG